MIKPIKNKIVVEKIENPTTTDSGIVLAGSLQEVDKALVLAVGSDVTDVKVGEKLLIDWQKAQNTLHEGKRVWIIEIDNVVAVFD